MAKTSLRRVIHDQLDTERADRRGLSFTNWPLVFLIFLSLLIYTIETEEEIPIARTYEFWLLNVAILCVFAIEFVLRLWIAGVDERFRGWRGLWSYFAANPFMTVVDFVAFAPELILIALGASPPALLRSLRIFRLFKIARYFPAFKLVVDALRSCIQELLVALSLSALTWYLASVILYLAENAAQPEVFGSITRSMWWSVITLTTVGYGDVYPVTIAGKVAAGVIAVVGVGTVALPSGIIAGAFIERFRARRDVDDRATI